MDKRGILIFTLTALLISILSFSFVSADITWYNRTDGFNVPNFIGLGIASNGSDIWVLDFNTNFVNHFDANFINLTDGFSTSISGCTAPRGLFFNGTQMISVNDNDNKLCVMNLDGSVAGGNGADLPLIFLLESFGSWVAGVSGNESDLWISESQNGARFFHLLPDYTDGGVIDFGTLTGQTSILGSIFNGSDFYVISVFGVDRRIFHLDLQGNLYENFSVTGFGIDFPFDFAFYQNVDYMNSPITDLWINDFNDGFVYHISTTAEPTTNIIGIAITPDPAYHTDTLNCSAIYTDTEGDKGNVSIYWYNGSNLFSSITKLDISNGDMISDVLPTGTQEGGEVWNCSINSTDSGGLSGIASSISIQISFPLIVSVDVPTITPASPKVADDLNCSTIAYISNTNPIYSLKVNLTLIKNGDAIQTWTKDTTNGSLVSQLLGSYQIGDNITCQAIAYANSSNSSTEEASAIIQQADYIINITNCMNITGSGTYQFTGNLNYDGVTNPCINITVDDVIIDGQGFEITGSTITNRAFSLMAGDNWRNNITIKNVNLSGYPSVAGWDTGFLINKASNCSFINNTVRATAGMGDWNGGSGAILQSSLIEGNRFYSSTANSPIGIWLQNESADNNIIRNNYFNIAGAVTGVCVYTNSRAGNNNYINNTMFCQTEALYFDTCGYKGNDVIGNEMTCTAETHGCLDLEGCQFNKVAGNKISGSLYAIGFQTFGGFVSSNNLFYDNQILSGTYSLKFTGVGVGYQNITFLNTTGITDIFEGFRTTPHEINVGWYVKITARNSLGVLGGANVSIYNRTGNLVVSGITQSNGNFSANLTEYTYQNTDPTIYHSLYNISITSNGYYDNSTEMNVLGNEQAEIFMSNIPIIYSPTIPCPSGDMICNALTGIGVGTGNFLSSTTRAVTPLAIAIPLIIAIIIFVVLFIRLFPVSSSIKIRE